MAGGEYIKFIPKLTKRELEVIEAVLAGALRYKSIASSLNISVNTVKTHLRKIYLTVGVNNTETLASLFHGYSPSKTGITPKSPLKNKKSPQIGDRKQHYFTVMFYNIMHSGGKKMQNLKALRTKTGGAISLVLVIALVIGIAAVKFVSGSKNQSSVSDPRSVFIGTWDWGIDGVLAENEYVKYVISADTVQFEFVVGDRNLSYTMTDITWIADDDPYGTLLPSDYPENISDEDPFKNLYPDYKVGYLIKGTIIANSFYKGNRWPEGIGEIRTIPIAMHKTDKQKALISMDFCAKL
jgi:DNA-binding CsgD family transcriptional regulator